MATYYVKTPGDGGDDGNDGITPETAFATPGQVTTTEASEGALGDFDSGHTVYIYPGSYVTTGMYSATLYGTKWIGVDASGNQFSDFDLSTGPGLTAFLAWYATRPTLDGGGSDVVTANHAWTLEGLNLTNGQDGIVGATTTVDIELRVNLCSISGITQNGITNIGDLLYPGSRITLNTFTTPRSALRFSTSDDDADVYIAGNLFNGCGTDGSSGSVIFAGNAGGATIEHNTLYGGGTINAPTGISATSATVQNNIVMDAAANTGISCPSGTERNNCVYASSGSYHSTANYDGGAGTGSLELNPLFTDAGGGDFTLQEASPARLTGTNLASLTRDILGVAFNDPPSMGAYAAAALATVLKFRVENGVVVPWVDAGALGNWIG